MQPRRIPMQISRWLCAGESTRSGNESSCCAVKRYSNGHTACLRPTTCGHAAHGAPRTLHTRAAAAHPPTHGVHDEGQVARVPHHARNSLGALVQPHHQQPQHLGGAARGAHCVRVRLCASMFVRVAASGCDSQALVLTGCHLALGAPSSL